MDNKYVPETEREKMLVEALLRKCRKQQVLVANIYADFGDDAWCLDGGTEVDIRKQYSAPKSKFEMIIDEIEKNMDTSAVDVFKEIYNNCNMVKEVIDNE